MPQFDTPINTNDQSIDRVLANPLPVVLALTANNTNSAFQSALEDIAKAQAGKLLVAKVNTGENPTSARRFGAQTDTTLITWKGNSEQIRIPNPSPDQVRAAAEHILGRGPAPEVKAADVKSDAHPVTVNEANFEQEVLRSAIPVLVDFWAAWCGPCHMIAPTLEKLSQEYAGKLRIAKLNVDENKRLASKYNAHSIPLLVLFKGSKAVQQIVGAHPEPSLRNFIERALQ